MQLFKPWLMQLLFYCLAVKTKTQDQNYYFPSPANQNRFVPSPTFQNTRSNFGSSNRFSSDSSSAYQPGSYQEQLLFVSNESPAKVNKPSSYSPFGSQYTSTRNSDFYGLSPRPFGTAATGAGGASVFTENTSNGFTRAKSIRNNNNNGFIPSQQQQQQQQKNTYGSDAASSRPQSGSVGGFVPSANRQRPPTNNFNSEAPLAAQSQQQVPFRNTRTRFQISTSTTATPSTADVSTKRYTRYGAGRSKAASYNAKTQPTKATTTIVQEGVVSSTPAITPNRPIFGRNKLTNLSAGNANRRPVFISREINEPVNLSKHKTTNKFNNNYNNNNKNGNGSAGRIKLTTINEQSLKKQVINTQQSQPQSSSVDEEDIEEANEDDEEEEEELPVENHVANTTNGNDDSPISLEKLGLLAANESSTITSKEIVASTESTNTTVNKSQNDEKPVILTSNFYLPDGSQIANIDNDAINVSTEEVDNLGNDKNNNHSESETYSTFRPTDYDYEYTEVEDLTEATITESNQFNHVEKPQDNQNNHNNNNDDNNKNSTVIDDNVEKPISTTTTTTSSTTSSNAIINSSNSNNEDVNITNKDLTTISTVNKDEANQVNEAIGGADDSEYEYVEGDEEEDEEGLTDVEEVDEETSSNGNEEYDEEEVEDVEEEVEGNVEEPVKETQADKPISNEANETFAREVISVVTTKSVVNGSTSFPSPVTPILSTLAMDEEVVYNENNMSPATVAYSTVSSVTTTEIMPVTSLQTDINLPEEKEQKNPILEDKIKNVENNSEKTDKSGVSTESIIDKLDRVQSELSSGLLSGKYPIINEMEVSTPATSTTSHNRFAPNIRKFMHKTTSSPKVKVHHVDDGDMDDLSGLLPAGFKPRTTFKAKLITTTRSMSTTSTTTEMPTSEEDGQVKPSRNFTSRSFKNNSPSAQSTQDSTLSKGLKTSTTEATTTTSKTPDISALFSKIKFDDDLSKFLPKDYKPTAEPKESKNTISGQSEDLSKFLPPGYKDKDISLAPEPLDITQLLAKKPKITSNKNTENSESTIKKVDVKNVSKSNVSMVESTSQSSSTSTDKSNSGFKVVFPKGIRKGLGGNRLTTAVPHSQQQESGTPTAVVFRKGPPVRATTEFTGWPTPSTTPIPFEKLLEQAKTISINFDDLLSTSSTSSSTTTTTTTTTTTPRPTKPGHCTSDCDLAATIKIVDGVTWKPELLDHNTMEWKSLAHEVEAQLNEVYSLAPELSSWYKKVRIDSFSKGSVLVDYYVELANITKDVNTLEIKKLFHNALSQPTKPIVPDSPFSENETVPEDENDAVDIKEEKLIKEAYQMGKFVIDPIGTDFSVIPKLLSATVEFAEDDQLLPQWAMVVIVIGVGSLTFVIIFGVSVLLNRQKRAKKIPVALTTDMLDELKINHMGGADNYGADDFYNIDDAWNDTKQPIKPKRFTNSMQGSSSSNIYDSWRSARHGDYFYDVHNTNSPSAKGDGLHPAHQNYRESLHHNQHSHHPGHHQSQQQQQHHYQHQHQQQQQQQPIYGHQYPDIDIADAHQMYTYNNHASRTRFPRDYDPDF